MRAVHGVVQRYAWGDREAIPRLLGVEPDGDPWAELWLGTHPGGPATVDGGRPLADVAGPLPYLLKVLAAGDALSLQTHPTDAQAAAGFAREEAAGVALDAPSRIYRDRSAKPELICALTPFDALCGFRPVAGSIDLLARIGAGELADRLRRDGLAATVAGLYRREIDPAPTVASCASATGPEAALVRRLADQYPDDPSVVVTLLLHRVRLEPGEALFLGPGNLHAYLHGVGVEIMAASDNVVRGGLTVKHVDVDELLAVLDVRPLDEPRITPREVAPGRFAYDTPATSFRLWRWELDGPARHEATGRELLLCTAGHAGVLGTGDATYLAPGDAVELDGPATVFRVEEVETVTG